MTNPEDIANIEDKETKPEKGQENKHGTPEEIVEQAEELVSVVGENGEAVNENLKSVGQSSESDKIGKENQDLIQDANKELNDFKKDVVEIKGSIVSEKTFEKNKINIEDTIIGDIKKVNKVALEAFIEVAEKKDSVAVIMARNEIKRRREDSNFQEPDINSEEMAGLDAWREMQMRKREDRMNSEEMVTDYLDKGGKISDELLDPENAIYLNIERIPKDVLQKFLTVLLEQKLGETPVAVLVDDEIRDRSKTRIEELQAGEDIVEGISSSNEKKLEQKSGDNNEKQEDLIPVEIKDETETKEAENLSVDEIIEKINKGEKVNEKGEEKLRKEIEKVILTNKPKEEWTDNEAKMMTAYIMGIDQGWFKEGEMVLMEINFDLENVKFNDLNTEDEKRDWIKKRKEDAVKELIERKVIENSEEIDSDYEMLKTKLQEQIMEEHTAYEELCNGQSAEDLFKEKGKAKMKDIIKHLKNSNQIKLDLERLEYYNFASDDSNINDLINGHHVERDYVIRMLEQSMVALDKMTDLFDKEERGELTEEEKGVLARIAHAIKENPKMSILAIMTLLAGIGLVAVYGPGIYAGVMALLGEHATEEIAKKTIEQAVKQGVGKGLALTGASMAIGGAGLLAVLFTALNEEQRDNCVKWLTNKPVPDWCRVGEKSSS
ncbi:hypothetical protein KAJ41_02370 [Candidatus Parcubacteria bacterium]|nr:hypothetical protein [Candidatus Parcubacteria bacterium]